MRLSSTVGVPTKSASGNDVVERSGRGSAQSAGCFKANRLMIVVAVATVVGVQMAMAEETAVTATPCFRNQKTEAVLEPRACGVQTAWRRMLVEH